MPVKVHFLNVGEGDCTIVEHASGRISLIDVSNVQRLDQTSLEESMSGDPRLALAQKGAWDMATLREAATRKLAPLTDAIEYFDSHIGRYKDIFRMIVTHPHMDHISGLHRIVTHEPKTIHNFWHVSKHDFDLDSDEGWSKVPSRYSRDDWRAYKRLRDSHERTFDQRKDAVNSYWSEDGIAIWAPTPKLVTDAIAKGNQNTLSMVLKISHAGRSVVLGGDATAVESWPAIYPDIYMNDVNVLKASHHGRNSGYHQPSVKEMSPWLTIVSVGQADHDATRKYRQYSDYTVSTRFSGDICLTLRDDGIIEYPQKLAEHWKPKLTRQTHK